MKTEELMNNAERQAEWLKEFRYIQTLCPKCHGAGVRTYGTTATWHGGIGGATLTPDICDYCWGSGDEDHPWTSLRLLKNILTKEQVEIIRKSRLPIEGGEQEVCGTCGGSGKEKHSDCEGHSRYEPCRYCQPQEEK